MPKAKSNLSKRTSSARRVANYRSHETAENHTVRVVQLNLRQSLRHERETDTQRELRLLQQRIQTENNRQRQSLSQERERLAAQRIRSARNRTPRQNPCGVRSAFSYQREFDYANLKDVQIGKMDKVCQHQWCQAKKWKDEAPGLCCAGGKVKLPNLEEPPEILKSLILGDHPSSKHFLDNMRKYNTLFQMTSFGGKEIREGNYMPTFKIQGQVYHLIGSLLPEDDTHKFLQIYFLSDADQVSTRMNINENLRQGLIQSIQNALHENNHLIKGFKSNIENRTDDELPDLKLIRRADRVPVNEHRGRYNTPTTNEVAVLLVNEDKGPRDIVLHGRNGFLQRVSELHRSYDALQYPLFFPRGEDGYSINILQHNEQNPNKTVSCMQFYASRLMVKKENLNYLFYCKNLLNQYAVDMMAKMISERLHFIRSNQKKLRAEEYVHLRDTIQKDPTVNPIDIGQPVILPSTFTGSPRYMHEKAQDAMAYVRKYGRPDLFITFTCNPEWIEIKQELLTEDQKPKDRSDLVARVFHLKLKKLMYLLKDKCIFGPLQCYMYSVEWQKRGLPHAHILLWLETKIQPDEIDKIISAELPDREADGMLFEIVSKTMVHGPCGAFNSQAPCMVDGKCSKRYPRDFVSHTQTGDDGYPQYMRRSPEDGGHTITVNVRGNTVELDNRWIVPHCPMLSRCFCAHINVEFCHTTQAIKYICKYINKGSDMATFAIERKDEIKQYENGRYICSSESFWRFFAFEIRKHWPPVFHLAVHLENHQRVYFTEGNINNVIENPRKTTLIAFFELCQADEFARTLFYNEVPEYYTYSNNIFHRRKTGKNVDGWPGVKKEAAVGRVYTIHPSQSECFHLRMLLHQVRGPVSFENLRTVDGVVFPTYKAACQALGLLENDDQWKNTLTDAAVSESPAKLRDLFAVILVFCQPAQPSMLWELFQRDFCQDILYNVRQRSNDLTLTFSEEIFNLGLIDIEDRVLRLSEKYLTDFGMTSPVRLEQRSTDLLENIMRHSYDTIELRNYVDDNLPKLVPDQKLAFDSIMQSVNSNLGKIFFIDAPGGTGKTFLINLLLAEVRSQNNLAVAVASSGIAATLLSGGRTAHSTFKLPLNVSLNQDFVCYIRKNSALGKVLQETKFIVWDECTMSHKAHIEAINRTLQDLRSNGTLMGGVTFVFAGDFRQTLPVIPKGTRADIVKSCLKSSFIWEHVENLPLRTNMRAHLGGGNLDFSELLLKIGEGKIANEDGIITLDNDKVGQVLHTLDDLISKVYPDICNLLTKPYQWLCDRAIVTPRNSSAQEINDLILEKFLGETQDYKSIDTVIDSEDAVNYPQEFLHALNPAGFPPHNLKLKVGTPIMLLRNLNPPHLCNGTRLQVKIMRNNIIEAVILTGPGTGETAFIPRIPMIPTDLPFQFKRLQFPIKISFAMTINKAQGQTINTVGVDLRSGCFSHGQLYVGLSRTGNPSNQFLLLPLDKKTKNVI